MLYYIFTVIWNECCFGKSTKQDNTLIKELKHELVEFSKEELNEIKEYLLRPLEKESFSCC